MPAQANYDPVHIHTSQVVGLYVGPHLEVVHHHAGHAGGGAIDAAPALGRVGWMGEGSFMLAMLWVGLVHMMHRYPPEGGGKCGQKFNMDSPSR